MNTDKEAIIRRAVKFFDDEVFASSVRNLEKLELSSLQLNPFLDKYRAMALRGSITSTSVAEGLVYPRFLGTSLNTIFGNKSQKFISEVLGAQGSGVSGMDIEFFDHVAEVDVYCQLKGGPQTINYDDIDTITGKFKSARRLLATNNKKLTQEQFVLGVLYGTESDLSGMYKAVAVDYPVYIGRDFWHRLTGESDFYDRLTDAIGESALKVDASKKIEEAVKRVADALENEPGFSFD